MFVGQARDRGGETPAKDSAKQQKKHVASPECDLNHNDNHGNIAAKAITAIASIPDTTSLELRHPSSGCVLLHRECRPQMLLRRAPQRHFSSRSVPMLRFPSTYRIHPLTYYYQATTKPNNTTPPPPPSPSPMTSPSSSPSTKPSTTTTASSPPKVAPPANSPSAPPTAATTAYASRHRTRALAGG